MKNASFEILDEIQSNKVGYLRLDLDGASFLYLGAHH